MNNINYYVSAKHTQNNKISHLKVHDADNINNVKTMSRSDVINYIERKWVFYTMYNSNGWKKGKQIHVVNTRNGKYLRTDRNDNSRDNLENLPEFTPTKNYSFSY